MRINSDSPYIRVTYGDHHDRGYFKHSERDMQDACKTNPFNKRTERDRQDMMKQVWFEMFGRK